MERDGATIALLVESPEPINWRRVDIVLEYADQNFVPPQLPGLVKLTDVSFSDNPNEESVSLLVRDTLDLTDYQIQLRTMPKVVGEPDGNPILFKDNFRGMDRGLLFEEKFGLNALDHYEIVNDSDITEQQPQWEPSVNYIAQREWIFGMGYASKEPDKLGTMAVTGSPAWTNVRIKADLRSESSFAIGIVFRYVDRNNYYRFSMDSRAIRDNSGNLITPSYRRLIKCADGEFHIIWQEEKYKYEQSKLYEVKIEVFDDLLVGYVNNVLLFNMQDSGLQKGRTGFYCANNNAAYFEKLEVELLKSSPILWRPAFVDLREVTIVDDQDATNAPSRWTVSDGVLTHSSRIQTTETQGDGTHAQGGSISWRSVQISTRLISSVRGSIGILFRYIDNNNYYRFSIDHNEKSQLIKKQDGVITYLWPRNRVWRWIGVFLRRLTLPINTLLRQNLRPSQYELTVCADSDILTVYLNENEVLSHIDDSLAHGNMGFYCSQNAEARFENVIITDRSRRIGAWTIHDDGTVNAPSKWRQHAGALEQLSRIKDASQSDDIPAQGTYVIAGNADWTDYRFVVKMRSDDDATIGVIFRYIDENNYYRLSLNSQSNNRRLVKNENGNFTLLRENTDSFTFGNLFTITVDVAGDRLIVYYNSARLFELTDNTHSQGKIGLYGWDNTGMHFEHVEVRRLPIDVYALFRDRFPAGDMSEWTVVNNGATPPPNWFVEDGVLRQTNLTPETHLVTGDPSWSDVVLVVKFHRGAGVTGVLFRYQDPYNYYLLVIDNDGRRWHLTKYTNGTTTDLWTYWAYPFTYGQYDYEVTVAMHDNVIKGYLSDIPMFVVKASNSELTMGRIGLMCSLNDNARFSSVRVYPNNLLSDTWLLKENFESVNPDRWKFVREGTKYIYLCIGGLGRLSEAMGEQHRHSIR